MVYVYSRQSQINKYIGKKISIEEIESTLKDMGMDIKGVSDEKDPQIKIEITAEKMDMISTPGVARAIKFYSGLQKELPKYKITKGKEKVIVDKSVEGVRPKTVAVILRNVPMDEEFLNEMIEIQEKIHDSFGRHRKKAAIGIYPIDEIVFPITYRAENGKDIVYQPLESNVQMNAFEILKEHETGKKYAHLLSGLSHFPVFRDVSGQVLSMPPIINSHKTGRVEAHHKDLFIECSGHNITHLDNILKVLVTTFIEMGATAESMDVEYPNGEVYTLNLTNSEDTISLDFVNKLIGINISEAEVTKLLNKVQYGVKKIEGDKIYVEIPSYRSDVWHGVDIADDIARAYGYNNIIPKFPNISTVGETLPFSDFKERFSQTLMQYNFTEIYTYMLTSTQIQFKNMELDENKFNYVRISDSADQGINMVRIMNLPESLSSLHINRKNKYPQKIFENGFTIQPDQKADTKARNESHLCVSIADPKSNYTQIKSILDTMMMQNGIDFEISESNYPYLIKGRQADIIVKGKKIGFIGELHPQVLTNFGLIVPVSSFEINLEIIYELVSK